MQLKIHVAQLHVQLHVVQLLAQLLVQLHAAQAAKAAHTAKLAAINTHATLATLTTKEANTTPQKVVCFFVAECKSQECLTFSGFCFFTEPRP